MMMVTLFLFFISTNYVGRGSHWRQEEGQVREGPQAISDRPHGSQVGHPGRDQGKAVATFKSLPNLVI